MISDVIIDISGAGLGLNKHAEILSLKEISKSK